MQKRLLQIVIGVLVICSVLLYLNKMLIKDLKEKKVAYDNKSNNSIEHKKPKEKVASNNEVESYVKRVDGDISLINKNWNIVKKYATIKTWLTDENESKIKEAFIKINDGWDDISKLNVPNNNECEKLHEDLMNCKSIQNHAMSLASEAMNTSNFDLMVESTEIIVDSNKFINSNILPLIKEIEMETKDKKK